MFATISDNNVKIITCSGTESQSKRAAKIANKIRGLDDVLAYTVGSHPRFTDDTVKVVIDGKEKSIEATFVTDVPDKSPRKKGFYIINLEISHVHGGYFLKVNAPTIDDGMISMMIVRNYKTPQANFNILRDTRFSVDKLCELFETAIKAVADNDDNELAWAFVNSIMEDITKDNE